MLNDEICKLRNKLNESIVSGKDYSIVYQLSIELDKLIAEYYKKLQPMTVFHRQLLQRDIGKINEKNPSPLLAAFTKHPIETPIMD